MTGTASKAASPSSPPAHGPSDTLGRGHMEQPVTQCQPPEQLQANRHAMEFPTLTVMQERHQSRGSGQSSTEGR